MKPCSTYRRAISFASPCVLPLVPGYLSYVTGMSAVDAQDRASSTGSAVATADEGDVTSPEGTVVRHAPREASIAK